MPEILFTPRQVAEILQYDVRTVQRMCKAREIPCLFIHGQYRFRPAAFKRWLEQQERGPGSPQLYGLRGSKTEVSR